MMSICGAMVHRQTSELPEALNILEVEFQLGWLFSLSLDAPGCRASWPSSKQPGPGEVNRGPHGGPFQYCAVHRCSVVRRVWGPGALAMFLIFGATRAGEILSPESYQRRFAVVAYTVISMHLTIDALSYHICCVHMCLLRTPPWVSSHGPTVAATVAATPDFRMHTSVAYLKHPHAST